MCECVDGFTCEQCLRELEADWRYEHERDRLMFLTNESETSRHGNP